MNHIVFAIDIKRKKSNVKISNSSECKNKEKITASIDLSDETYDNDDLMEQNKNTFMNGDGWLLVDERIDFYDTLLRHRTYEKRGRIVVGNQEVLSDMEPTISSGWRLSDKRIDFDHEVYRTMDGGVFRSGCVNYLIVAEYVSDLV
jgi:hypothetical protein